MYSHYLLTLMVTHACNMRCSYCYAGKKTPRPMPESIGRRAIDRASASVAPGGMAEVGFFGGEPLLEPELISLLMHYARAKAEAAGAAHAFTLTSNGTVAGPAAWALMLQADLALVVSFDGLPELHDRHRRLANDQPTSGRVLETMRRLLDAGKEFRVIVVVRPDTVAHLAQAVEFLYRFGARDIDLNLDLWARWSREDVDCLERAVAEAAAVWRRALPNIRLNWFDDKTARLCGLDTGDTPRCGFGAGQIAATPSGNLYPCERLISDDADDNPMRLPGRVMDGADFLSVASASPRRCGACSECGAEPVCNTFCRCSNYVRTGDVTRPDGLLCRWNKACARATADALSGPPGPVAATAQTTGERRRDNG